MDRDWIQLWMLNELVCSGSCVARLIHQPHEQWTAPWNFPGRAALHASERQRANALLACVREGFVEVYPSSVLNDTLFAPLESVAAQECRFHNEEFVSGTEVFISRAGHERWEADFRPDWERYWKVESVSRENDQCHLSVVFASDQMRKDLVKWLPCWFGLDRSVGLNDVQCDTIFRYPATEWKIISVVKNVLWRGLSDTVALNRIIRGSDSANLSAAESEGERVTTLPEYYARMRHEHDVAVGILGQFSNKWACAHEEGNDRRDAEPVLLGGG